MNINMTLPIYNLQTTYEKVEYISVDNCLNTMDIILRNSRIQSLIIVLMFILIVVLFYKLNKERKKEKEKITFSR
jgi:hypothetical protein